MDTRKLDGLIAEQVFATDKWSVWWDNYDDEISDEGESPVRQGYAVYDSVPHYTTDAAADYLVLVHVRESWDQEKRHLFEVNLEGIWLKRNRWYTTPVWYEPGDYSRAALAVLGIETTE